MEFSRLQRKIINSRPSGHMLIKGLNGTGKTTALINKIPSLLNKYCIAKDDKILIAAYNEEHSKKLAFIYDNIDEEKYHQNSFFDTDNKDKLDISTIDSLLIYYFNQYNKSHKKELNIASYEQCKNELRAAINTVEEKYGKKKPKILSIEFFEFIQEEINWIKACNYISLEEYQGAMRNNRVGKTNDGIFKILRKNSKQRQAIYEILTEYNNNLRVKNKIDFEDMVLLALKEAQKENNNRYTHIFIDNSQDLTKTQLEFLKALYNEKNYSSITFTVDSNEYNNPYAWLVKGRSFASLGYDMKGKSVTLKNVYTEVLANREEAKINTIKANEIIREIAISENKLNISPLILNTTQYIDFKRNVTHKFIKDFDSLDEFYIDYEGTQEKVDDLLSIPVFNEIAAGSPILMNDSVEDTYSLPKEWIRSSKDVFMLKVKGDSMINRNIYDGDYVVINKQNTPNVRDIVAVDIEGEATLKTYRIMDGKIVLMPENNKYSPIILEDQDFRFLGVAIGLIKNS